MSTDTLEKTGWLGRLKQGLKKSSTRLGDGITTIFTHRRLDDEALDDLEELLISVDLGVGAAARVRNRLESRRFEKDVTPGMVKAAVAEEVESILAPYARTVDIDPARRPFVIMVVGVNGNGKTTTVGKMANLLKDNGFSVMVAAGDTFRAAAIEQLAVWVERAGVDFFAEAQGTDPASTVYKAYEEAARRGTDILLIDTAGRLHNKANLMDELGKMVRVLKKLDPEAPHSTILILDGTTGQNAHTQLETFKTIVNVTGLVVTKLDGTAKGGVVVSLAERFKLPIHAIGVGEGMEDLREFTAHDFARNLMHDV